MSYKKKPPIIYRSKSPLNEKNFIADLCAFKDHLGMNERVRKTLYYGQLPKTERPSQPLSELVVEMFSEVVPDGLGCIDMDYATSVSRNACVSPCAMILAMAYIERLRRRSPGYLQQVSSSDLFLISMMVASKFLYDDGEEDEVFNDEWAVAANMDVKDVNQQEMNFLRAIDWNVFVNPATFAHYLHRTEFILAMRKSRERGWCTYAEIEVLTRNVRVVECWQLLVDYVAKVIVIGAVAYTASVLVLVGATEVACHIRTHISSSSHAIRDAKHNQPSELPSMDSDSNLLNDNDSLSTSCLQSLESAFLGDLAVCAQQQQIENVVSFRLYSSTFNTASVIQNVSPPPSPPLLCLSPTCWLASQRLLHDSWTGGVNSAMLVGDHTTFVLESPSRDIYWGNDSSIPESMKWNGSLARYKSSLENVCIPMNLVFV